MEYLAVFGLLFVGFGILVWTAKASGKGSSRGCNGNCASCGLHEGTTDPDSCPDGAPKD